MQDNAIAYKGDGYKILVERKENFIQGYYGDDIGYVGYSDKGFGAYPITNFYNNLEQCIDYCEEE